MTRRLKCPREALAVGGGFEAYVWRIFLYVRGFGLKTDKFNFYTSINERENNSAVIAARFYLQCEKVQHEI